MGWWRQRAPEAAVRWEMSIKCWHDANGGKLLLRDRVLVEVMWEQ